MFLLICEILYVKQMSITKQNRLKDTKNKLVITCGEREREKSETGAGQWMKRLKTTTYKINKIRAYSIGDKANILK